MAIKEKELLSVTDVSQLLGISRTHVLRKIQAGEIKAEKIGKSYIIRRKNLPGIHRPTDEMERKKVEEAIDKTMADFGEVIRKLGRKE